MKIGKENMVGLVYALENYHRGQAIITAETSSSQWLKRFLRFTG